MQVRGDLAGIARYIDGIRMGCVDHQTYTATNDKLLQFLFIHRRGLHRHPRLSDQFAPVFADHRGDDLIPCFAQSGGDFAAILRTGQNQDHNV